MFLCILINCISDGFNSWTISLTKVKSARTIRVLSNTLSLDELAGIEHITYLGEDYANMSVGITDSSLKFAEDGKYIDNFSLLTTSYYDNVVHTIAGEPIKEGMRKVALIPNRFQPNVYYDFSGYFKPNAPLLKGKDFIGETITYTYSVLKDYGKPPSDDNWEVFTDYFTVIGVYDILECGYGGPDIVFLPLEDMKEHYNNSATEDSKIMNQKEYALVVDKAENVPAVKEELNQIRQRIIEEESKKYADKPELQTTESIRYMGPPKLKANPTRQLEKATTIKKAVQTISIALLTFLLISIYLLVLSSLNKRKSQIALLKVQGYSFSQITACLILEGVFICLLSVIISLLISFLLLIVFGHTIIVTYLGIGYETLQISTPFYLKTAVLCAFIGSLGTVAGVYVASGKVAKIEAAQALKE
jgi:ABC-type antimicrobial peptide transport system permease subunit